MPAKKPSSMESIGGFFCAYASGAPHYDAVGDYKPYIGSQGLAYIRHIGFEENIHQYNVCGDDERPALSSSPCGVWHCAIAMIVRLEKAVTNVRPRPMTSELVIRFVTARLEHMPKIWRSTWFSFQTFLEMTCV